MIMNDILELLESTVQELLVSTVQIIILANGTRILAKIEKTISNGLIVSNPVTCEYVDSTIYFNSLFHGMNKNDFIFLPSTHIITFTQAHSQVASYYEDFIKDSNDRKDRFLSGDKQQKSSNTITRTYH